MSKEGDEVDGIDTHIQINKPQEELSSELAAVKDQSQPVTEPIESNESVKEVHVEHPEQNNQIDKNSIARLASKECENSPNSGNGQTFNECQTLNEKEETPKSVDSAQDVLETELESEKCRNPAKINEIEKGVDGEKEGLCLSTNESEKTMETVDFPEKALGLKIVNIESRANIADASEEVKSDDDDELIIDLEDSKKAEKCNDTNDSLNSETDKQYTILKTTVINENHKSTDEKTKTEAQVGKQNGNGNFSENDEMATSFEKLEKSLREFRESLSRENGEDSDSKEKCDVVDKTHDIKSDKQQEQSAEKQLEEEMESLLKEYQESTNKTINLEPVESNTGNENPAKGNVLEIGNRSPDVVEELTIKTKEDQKDKISDKENDSRKEILCSNKMVESGDQTVNESRTESDSKVTPENMESSGKSSTNLESSDGSIKVKPKQKLYDSNELWSKMGMNRCKSCNFTTDDETFFQQHTCSKKTKSDIVVRIKDNKFHCEPCLYTSTSKKMFEEHLGYHLLSHPFICLECKTTFEKNIDLEKHVQTKHPNETVRCGLRALKKIGDIIENLCQYGVSRFAGRPIDGTTLISIMQSKDKRYVQTNAGKNKAEVSYNSQSSSSPDTNMDSSESVVIYLSDSPTNVSNVVPANVTSCMGSSNPVPGNITSAPVGAVNASSVPIGQQSVATVVASNKGQAKIPISKPTLKVPTYTAPVKTTAQVKNAANFPPYVTNSTPVFLIPVTNVMNVGLPQSPGATVNLSQRMATATNTFLTSTPVHPGSSTSGGVPARGTLSLISQPNVPTSPLTTTARFQGGQFINISQTVQHPTVVQTVQHPTVVNQPVLENSQRTRLIILPETASNIPTASNQVVGIANVVGNVTGTPPVIATTVVVPVVGQTIVSRSSQPLTTITTSAPPPTYEETIKNQQNQMALGANRAWTSILNKSLQNNTYVKSTQQVVGASDALSSSSVQKSATLSQPTSSSVQMSATLSQTTVSNAAKNMEIPSIAPKKVMVKTMNVPILPKPLPNEVFGVLATSTVTTGEKVDGRNKLYFRKSGGLYTCDYCRTDTDSEEMFRQHIWKHFHELQVLCKLCPSKSYDASLKCSLVERVLIGLQCAAASQIANKDTEKKSNEPESVVILSDDDDGDDDEGSEQNMENLDNVINSVDKISESENKSDSVMENREKIDNESAIEPRSDKEENDSGLQLKITSIVSLHRSKKSNESAELEEKASEDKTANKNVDQRSDETAGESQKKVGIYEAGNIFDKFAEESRVTDGISKESNSVSSQHQTDGVGKNVSTNQSEPLGETVASAEATSGFDNEKDTEQKDTNSQSSASNNNKPVPGYEYGGSFYVCGFKECSFRCLTSPEFRDHLLYFHSNATEFTCAHCGHKSYTEECYLRHMFVHSNAKSFMLFLCKCGACKFGTNLINLFREHLNKTHPSEGSYKCSSCHESFQGIEELISHLQSNLLKFVQCPYCTVKDRNRRFILTHISQMHPGKVKQITVTSQLICQERESNAYVAPQRDQTELSETLSNSAATDKTMYNDPPSLVKEEPMDTFQETVGNVVDSVFNKKVGSQKQPRRTSEDSVKSDMKSGNSAPSLMKCPHCSYIANGKGFLKKHLKVHDKGVSKQRPFMCPYCPGEADTQTKFVSHVGLHCGNQKPNGIFKIQIYFCSHCSFQSNLLGKIFSHGERAHATFRKETDYTTSTVKIKSRSFMCETCTFFTRSKEDYDRHMDMHKNEELSNSVKAAADIPSKETVVNESPSKNQNEVNVGNESRRFCCKECNKTFKRLPHLKQHLSVHIKNESYQLTYFRCSYCGFSSTSKLCISRHTEEKHPGKLIRIKRRVESVSSAKAESQLGNSSEPPKVSIDTYHCDCCAFSCSNREDLIRHTKLHFVTTSDSNRDTNTKMEKPQKKAYDGPTEPFVIPAGNVYKAPVSCTKCNFSTKLRLELLRHVKMHPMLIPESEQSPRKEGNPQDKATKLLVKTTFLKRRLSSSPDFKPAPRKKKKIGRLESSSDEDDDDEMDIDDIDEYEDSIAESESKKPQKDTSQSSRKMEISKGSLYFLGGDLLHNKLKPCYSEEGGKGEFTCLYCGSLLEENYPLHKHLLQHMDVSFYKCAYCEFGALEVTPIVIHIQRQHRKPIKHIQQPLNEVESKINKAIHDMKAQHYLGVPSESPVKPASDEAMMDIKLETPDDEQELDVNGVESEIKNEPISPFKTSSPKTMKSPSRLLQERSPNKLNITKLGPHVKPFGLLLRCKICGYTSSSRATINRHGVVHTSFKRYGCPYCTYRSHWKPDVYKHVTNVHAGEEVKCVTHPSNDALTNDLLSKQVAAIGELSENLDIKNDSESVKDNKASELGPVPTDDIMKKSITEFSSKFKCNICASKFNSKWAIHKHFRTTECGGIPMFGCSLCRFKNVKDEAVKDHIKLKHQLSPSARVTTLSRAAKYRIHKIPVRNKEQKMESNSVQSNKTENESSPRGSKGNAVSQMKVERTRERNGLIKKVGNLYKCKVCSYRGQRSNVSRHLSTHSQLIKHACPFCDYKSNWNFNIKRHVRKYHSDKNEDLGKVENSAADLAVTLNTEQKGTADSGSTNSSDQAVDKNIVIKKEPSEENVLKIKYKCLVCKQIKLSLSGIYRHLQGEKCNKPMYGCPECRFKSMSNEQVMNHISEKHVGQSDSPILLNINAKIKKIKYRVNPGGIVTENKDSLVSSRKGKAVEVTCPSCNHVSPSRKLYQEHFDKSHKGMFMACTKCPYKTQLMIYFYKHTVKVHQSRDIQFEIHRKKMRNKDVRFQCPKCNHQAKKPNMRAHLYFHLDYRPINCGHCSYKTRKQMIAKKHILSNHPGLPLKIIVKQDKNVEAEIDQMLSSMKVAESDLQQHTVSEVEVKERKQQIECEFENCDFKCMKNKTMKVHVSVMHMNVDQNSESDFRISTSPIKVGSNNKDEYPPIDAEIFSPRKNYTTVFSSKLHKEVFKCKHCPYVASVKKSMVSHYYLHVPHIFKCPYCSYKNYPRSRVVHHITTNHGAKTLYVIDLRTNQTAVTDTSHTSSPDSSISSSSHKKNPSPPKKAKKEKKKFVSVGSYSDIFTSEGSSDENSTPPKKGSSYKETGKISYCCNFCNYKSSVFYHYRQHLAIHGGFKWQTSGTIIESRLKCGMCSFLAINDEEFKNHMEKHLNTRPFVCPYCDFSAFMTSSVKKHVVSKHPDKPVKALKNDQSGDLVVAEGGPKKNIKLVEMEPKVKLYDIFSMESEDFEQLLTDADVSVIDLQYIPDEKFDIVSKTLGFSAEDIQELEDSDVMDSDYEDDGSKVDDEVNDEAHLMDETVMKTAYSEDEADGTRIDDSLKSIDSIEYETLDEISDSINEEQKESESKTEDLDKTLDYMSDMEEEANNKVDEQENDKSHESEKDNTDEKQSLDVHKSENSEIKLGVKQDLKLIELENNEQSMELEDAEGKNNSGEVNSTHEKS